MADLHLSGGRTADEPRTGGMRAAQYARMSTEHQKYSTENQADAIQQYANRRGIEIVRTYADEGKSGLGYALLVGPTRHSLMSHTKVIWGTSDEAMDFCLAEQRANRVRSARDH